MFNHSTLPRTLYITIRNKPIVRTCTFISAVVHTVSSGKEYGNYHSKCRSKKRNEIKRKGVKERVGKDSPYGVNLVNTIVNTCYV